MRSPRKKNTFDVVADALGSGTQVVVAEINPPQPVKVIRRQRGRVHETELPADTLIGVIKDSESSTIEVVPVQKGRPLEVRKLYAKRVDHLHRDIPLAAAP